MGRRKPPFTATQVRVLGRVLVGAGGLLMIFGTAVVVHDKILNRNY